VIEDKKSAYGTFELTNGKNTIVSFDLTDAELAAYQSHPDTFFGRYDSRAKGPLKDPLELYDWLHKSYAKASREQLLTNMKGAEDFHQLELLMREDLLSIYCERLVYGVMRSAAANKPVQSLP
jgi:hypothetical protein